MSSLPVVLLFAPLSFGIIAANTGTAVCNGSNVSLDYTNINTGGGSNFTVDVISISGATIDSVTCSDGAAIYALSGSRFTVTFGPVRSELISDWGQLKTSDHWPKKLR